MACTFWLIVGCLGVGVYEVGCDAADLQSAHTIYRDRFAEAEEGVHRAEALLFVVVEIADASHLSDQALETRLLLRTVDLLRQYVSDASGAAVNAPPLNVLLDRYSWLMSECRAINPRFATRAIELKNVETRVLENRPRGKGRRHVMALAESDVEKLVEGTSFTPPSVEETVNALRQRLESLDDNQPESVVAMLLRVGAIEDALAREHDRLVFEIPLLSYGEPRPVLPVSRGGEAVPAGSGSAPEAIAPSSQNALRLDSLDLLNRLRSMEQRIAAPDVGEREVIAMLREWPGYPPALKWLSRHHSEADRPVQSIILAWLSFVDGDDDGERPKRLVRDIERWGKAAPNAAGFQEYAALANQLCKAVMPESLASQKGHPAFKLVHRAWLTGGHINPPSPPTATAFTTTRPNVTPSGESPKKKRGNKPSNAEPASKGEMPAECAITDGTSTKVAVNELAEQIRTETDISAAGERFLNAIQNHPHEGSLWTAMGIALLASGDSVSAVPFLNQSLKFNPESAAVRLMLARTCERLGYHELRRGFAFSALLRPTLTNAQREAALTHLKASPAR